MTEVMCEKKVVAVVPSCLKKRKNEDNRDNNDNIFIPELMREKKLSQLSQVVLRKERMKTTEPTMTTYLSQN